MSGYLCLRRAVPPFVKREVVVREDFVWVLDPVTGKKRGQLTVSSLGGTRHAVVFDSMVDVVPLGAVPTAMYLLGRLADGAERDSGRLNHAVGTGRRASCGAQPGKRSVGWQDAGEAGVITCQRCLVVMAAREKRLDGRPSGAGLVKTARSKVSGGWVSVYRAIEAGMDKGGGPYVTVCEVHGTLCNHATLRLAFGHLLKVDWCEACMALVPA